MRSFAAALLIPLMTSALMPANAFAQEAIATGVATDPTAEVTLAVPPPRPIEYPVTFDVADFEAKPWTKEFEWVIVVNRADEGADRQSIRVYHNQQPVTYEEVASYLQNLTAQETMMNVKDETMGERDARIQELAGKQWAPGVFKVSTGRNAFEAKGEHHSQHASWSVTPTGAFVPQRFEKKHKSESYSNKMCDSFFGRLVSALTRKELCTYMQNATFFNGGIALHKAIPGTEDALGGKASGGCVRLPAALAEYLFHVLDEATGKPVPVVRNDGTVETTATGDIVRETVSTSPWGTLEARSALIIVQDQVK